MKRLRLRSPFRTLWRWNGVGERLGSMNFIGRWTCADEPALATPHALA